MSTPAPKAMTRPRARGGIGIRRATTPPMTSDEAAKRPQRNASSSLGPPGPARARSVLLGERLAELGLVLGGEVGVDQLGVGAGEGLAHAVQHGVGGHDEKG